MSLTYDIGNPYCGIPIYETTNQDEWVECQVAPMRRNSIIFSIVVVIVIILVFSFSDATVIKVIVAAGVLLLCAGVMLDSFLFAPTRAKREWKQFEVRLGIIKDTMKMDEPQARAEYRNRIERERELATQKEMADAQNKLANAQMANAATSIANTGFGMYNAFKK